MPAHGQYTPSGEETSKWSVFLQFSDEVIRKRVQKAVPESTKKSMCFVRVLFCLVFAPLLSLWEENLKNSKDNKLLWARKYARTVVLGHYLFLEANSCPRANCSLLGTDNILGQLSVHISSPKVVYCLYNVCSYSHTCMGLSWTQTNKRCIQCLATIGCKTSAVFNAWLQSVAKLATHSPKFWNFLDERRTTAKKNTVCQISPRPPNQCWSLFPALWSFRVWSTLCRGRGKFYLGLEYSKIRHKRSSVSSILQPTVVYSHRREVEWE